MPGQFQLSLEHFADEVRHVAELGLGGILLFGIPAQKDIHILGHALQCRLTTENPENNFIPDYGRITAYEKGLVDDAALAAGLSRHLFGTVNPSAPR